MKKKQIVDAAYTLFIEKGYAATSIQDILDRAKISKGTFYNYFTSKGECLRGILEAIAEETEIKRRQAATGEQINDAAVLSEQIAIRLRINKERKLFPLFESIFHSEDAELKAFAKQLHFSEIYWLAGRITDVYGEQAAPFALENSALVLGTIQHLIHLHAANATSEMSAERLTDFVLRRMEASLVDQLQTNDTFLPFTLREFQTEQPNALLEIHARARTLADKSEDQQTGQLLSFIADELKEPNPRTHLIGSVVTTLENDGILTPEFSHDIRQALTES
ncbi:TetR/AcrR family transcriptional regulator [Planococcus lenghuensis]|nr:TetR/AcrR family transcriptional regulator [Planococcus lenghuensis]